MPRIRALNPRNIFCAGDISAPYSSDPERVRMTGKAESLYYSCQKNVVYFAWPYYPFKSLSRKGDLMICQTNSQNSIAETSAHITKQTVLVPCQISRHHSWLHSRRFIVQATHSEAEVWSDWDVSSKAKFAFVLVFCFYFMHCFVLCWFFASWVRIRQVQLANNDAWNKRGIKTRGQRSGTHTFSKLWSFYRWVAWT